MRMHRWGSLAVVATVSLAGCGDGGERLTKEQYVQQGNQLCERIEGRVTQAASSKFSEQGEIPSADRIEDFVQGTLSPAIEEELDGLRELNPPERDEERVGDILTAGQRALEEIRRDPTSVIGQESPLEDYDELADGYGLERCGAVSEEVERALAGLGPSGPVRGGDGTTASETGGEGEGEGEGVVDEQEEERPAEVIDDTEGTGEADSADEDSGTTTTTG